MAGAPQPSASLSFCAYDGYKQKGCCSKQEDANLLKKFEYMNVSDTECAGFIKEILCAVSHHFSAVFCKLLFFMFLTVHSNGCEWM